MWLRVGASHSEEPPMNRLSLRRLASLAVTLAILALPAIVAALTAAPIAVVLGGCGHDCE